MNRLIILWLLVVGPGGSAALACTVPVFRYALDHWPADPYRLEVQSGWLEAASGREWRNRMKQGGAPIELHPLSDPGAPSRLMMPDNGPEVWKGDLDGSASRLLISAARKELLRRILSGESMVWVVVQSGNESADNAFEKQLRERLEYLQSVAAIPEQDPTDPINKLGPGPPLKVEFSFLTVSCADPEEEVFIRMLAGPETELLGKDEPFGAVVFGRGRVLGAWPTAELGDEGIDEVTLFLLGACSCRVKFQNPGWDLALAVNWDEALLGAQMEAERNDESSSEEEQETQEKPQDATPAPEVVRFEVSAERREGGSQEAAAVGTSGKAGGVIGILVASLGVVILVCLFGARGDPKGS